ncbi:flagellar filament capping protein FliD [Sporosarcina sp. E16_3]|uniref:flagellar filament capping protein FliD n=1 Tax=Sporosarcina sp. E16_3 TaxID=2789293 RepID=UPI001A932729|nr:flagellar filament capping protein FliD [Sporosarcina sp. E16_3]MBO0603321.1 flagellar filament capping protein FliD [Sporosarcina sp. E16_3]
MRISGLASGMDTESMIKDMMNAHRIPLNKITQKKQYVEWQMDNYRATNRQLFDFSKKTFDTMILSTSFAAKTVNISSPDDVAIRNMGSTSDFSGSIKVDQLAKNATLQSGELKAGNVKLSDEQFKNSTLKELGINGTELLINSVDANGKMTTEKKPLVLNETDTLKTVLDRINKETGVNAFYDSHTGKIAMTAKNSGAGKIEVSGDLGKSLGLTNKTIQYDGKKTTSTLKEFDIVEPTKIQINRPGQPSVQLEFGPDNTLGYILKKINEKVGGNTFQISANGEITKVATEGEAEDITFSGDLSAALGLNSNSTTGQNSKFTFNGLETERSSNTFQINGFEFNLKQVTPPDGAPISFSSAPDTDKIFDSVTKFVDEYNKLIEDLNKQIREPKYRDFQPLSAEQKKDMKEDEIKQWEEKAKSGTLRRDPTISSMLTQMRTALMGTVGSDTLKSLGITTSNDYTANGKLVINETELKKAISDDPNKVHEMFSKDGATVAEQGFARKLRTIVDKTQTSIAQRAGKTGSVNDTFSLGRSLKEMNSQIERFEVRLQKMESRYWKQFTAMETAINRANAQSASLMNAFSNN